MEIMISNKINKMFFQVFVSRTIKKFVPDIPFFIISGVGKGSLIYGRSGNLSYILGTHEKKYIELFAKSIKKNMVVYDIGAHIGYFSLIASKRTEEEGAVYAFEPFPRNYEYIKKHIRLNKCKNITAFLMAILDRVYKTKFSETGDHSMGKVSKNGKIFVKVFSIDFLLKKGIIFPLDIVKIDVEGDEYLVLKGMKQTLNKYKPNIFLEAHSKYLARRCISYLKLNYNYSVEDIDKENITYPHKLIFRMLKK